MLNTQKRLSLSRAFVGLSVALLSAFHVSEALGQTQTPVLVTVPPIRTLNDFLALDATQLDATYASGTASALPAGKVKGLALRHPGKSFARPSAKASSLVWQGKVIDPTHATAVNRFFGVKAVRGDLSLAQSWRDGQPAVILDYQQSSWVYARYRDEIRQVAPGLYLGLMYERTTPTPTLKLYFALEARP